MISSLSNEKKLKAIEYIYHANLANLKKLAEDKSYANAVIQETGLSLLHMVCNLNPKLIAAKNKQNVTTVENEINEIILILIQNGADVDMRDKHGRLPLHFAASQGNVTAMSTIIPIAKSSCNPQTIVNQGGETPLMKAIYFNKVAAAKFLLSQGIDFTIKNGCGKSALDYIKQINSPELEAILKKLYSRYRSRILWIFVMNFGYCKKAIPYQDKLERKQKLEVLSYL